MTIKDDGGSAFPCAGSEHGYPVAGASLRDYFAAKAAIGLSENSVGDPEWLAKHAYAVADAMLAERAK